MYESKFLNIYQNLDFSGHICHIVSMTQDYSYKTLKNNIISITAFGVDGMANKDCIIFVHGFKGFKDWGFVPYTAEHLANKGFFVVTFNFSHNGVDDNGEFTEPDKFAENTFSLEIEELDEIISAYKNGFFGVIEDNNIGLLGHSRGGGVSIITASENKNIVGLVTWSSVAKFDRYTERQKSEWREKGIFEVLNSRTKQVMKLNLSLLEDIEENKYGRLNILNAAGKLSKRFLLVHGEQDLTVPIKEAEMIYDGSDNSLTEFIKIPGAGHTFDIKHPFEGSNHKFDKVLKETEEFFTSTFKHSEANSG